MSASTPIARHAASVAMGHALWKQSVSSNLTFPKRGPEMPPDLVKSVSPRLLISFRGHDLQEQYK